MKNQEDIKLGLKDNVDEISYLHEVYNHSLQQLSVLKRNNISNTSIKKAYSLRKLLIDSYSLKHEEYEDFAAVCNMQVKLNEKFMICLIKIDDYKAFSRNNNEEDAGLYRFAIINVLTELISDKYPCEAVDMLDNHIALLIEMGSNPDDMYKLLHQEIKQAQKFINTHYNFSFSAILSEPIDHWKNTTKQYNIVLSNALYTFVYGKMTIIEPSTVLKNKQNTALHYTSSTEAKLVEGIKTDNVNQAEMALSSIINEISYMSYTNVRLSILKLINSLKATVEELNRTRLKEVDLNFDLLAQQMYEADTIIDFSETVLNIIRRIDDISKDADIDKLNILVDAIKEIIHSNYHDSALCIQSIASILKMSPVYIGKIFKSITQISITEYINDLRLRKAIAWMEDTELAVNEIVRKIGMENETYFYRLFKKKYGVTPKEYTMKKSMGTIETFYTH